MIAWTSPEDQAIGIGGSPHSGLPQTHGSHLPLYRVSTQFLEIALSDQAFDIALANIELAVFRQGDCTVMIAQLAGAQSIQSYYQTNILVRKAKK